MLFIFFFSGYLVFSGGEVGGCKGREVDTRNTGLVFFSLQTSFQLIVILFLPSANNRFAGHIDSLLCFPENLRKKSFYALWINYQLSLFTSPFFIFFIFILLNLRLFLIIIISKKVIPNIFRREAKKIVLFTGCFL